ncbi:glycerol-3-phosphate 2-O-acyltransferase 6-like [Miscanthus floridulus]|uniref:glycerol-3-phosphate 2-O-acyltransferase 6-like n=1 Tax=Miscanthus floridulus TaxID=154761 RepID=UPI00345834AF
MHRNEVSTLRSHGPTYQRTHLLLPAPLLPPATPLPRSEYRRLLVFHDGRLVCRPDPLACLAIFLWLPLGVLLSVTHLLLGFLPNGAGLLLAVAMGFRIRGTLGGAAEPAGAMFHGSTVRGHKWLDSVFFLINPAPWYEIRILTPVATCSSGASGLDVANGIQRVIGDALGFECTRLTGRDKYRMIAGHDVVDARLSPPKPPPS